MQKLIALMALSATVWLTGSVWASSSTEVNEVTLKKDTLLSTPGNKFNATFKEGTKTKLDGNGKVLAGTLAQETLVNCIGGKKMWFKEGSYLTFNKDAEVDSGILFKNTAVRPTGTTDVVLKAGTLVWFHPNGLLMYATLQKESLLSVRKTGKALKFQADSQITFDDKGMVISGVIATPVNFKSPEGATLHFPAGSRVEFNEEGKIANLPPPKKD